MHVLLSTLNIFVIIFFIFVFSYHIYILLCEESYNESPLSSIIQCVICAPVKREFGRVKIADTASGRLGSSRLGRCLIFRRWVYIYVGNSTLVYEYETNHNSFPTTRTLNPTPPPQTRDFMEFA